MVDSQLGVVLALVVYLIVVYIHEWGHYAVARWVVGIPASEVTIVMTDFPQYVALRDGEEWVSPEEEDRHDEIYQRYDPGYERAQLSVFNLFAGGGVLGQAIGVVAIAGLLLAVGEAAIAELFVEISILFMAAYLLMDLAGSVFGGSEGFSGDLSGHWHHSPLGTVLLVVIFAAFHVPLFVLL